MDIYKELSNEEIIEKQKEQHSQSRKKNLTVQRTNVRAQDIALLKEVFPNAKSVLCVGSREDSEVRDFIDNGLYKNHFRFKNHKCIYLLTCSIW